MARVDWCIVPSTWWEIFGLVISEAWMFGKPVICSNVGGPAERVVDERGRAALRDGRPSGAGADDPAAATEAGLWETLAANVPAPPARSAMVEHFQQLYAHDERLVHPG